MLFALAAVAFSSCNSKSEAWYIGAGSLEPIYMTSTLQIINYDGGKLFPLNSDLKMQDGVEREYIEFSYTIDEALSTEEKTSILLQEAYRYQTKLPTMESEAGFEKSPVLGLGESLGCNNNFISFVYTHFLFKENATSGNTYAIPSFEVEVDPELIPAVNGTDFDTINMQLYFYPNRKGDEKIDTQAVGINYAALDLKPLFQGYDFTNFPASDASGNDNSYIIKLNVLIYDVDSAVGDFDEKETKTVALTTKWTPNEPYVKATPNRSSL